jgi:DNA-binding beta-propeller fold protein YncE
MYEPVNQMQLGYANVKSIITSKQDSVIYALSDAQEILTIDPIENEIIDRFFVQPGDSFVFDQDNEIFYVASSSSNAFTAYSQDSTGNFVKLFTDYSRSPVNSLLLSSDGGILILFSQDSVGIYDTQSQTMLPSGLVSGSVDGFQFDPSLISTTTTIAPLPNTFIYFTSKTEDKVYRYNISSSSIDAEIDVGFRPEKIIESSGNIYVANYLSDYISVIDNATLSVTNIPSNKGTIDFALDTKRNSLYVLNSLYNKCYILDLSTNQITNSFITTELCTSIVLDPDLNIAIIASENPYALLLVDTNDFSITSKSLIFRPSSISLDSVSKNVFISDFNFYNFFRMNLIDKTVIRINRNNQLPINYSLLDNPNNRIIAVSQLFDIVSLFDSRTGDPLLTIGVDNSPSSVAIDHHNQIVYISHPLNDKISVYNYKTFKKLYNIPTLDSPDSLLFVDANPAPTTTTTTNAPFSTTLEIPENSSTAIESHLIFYGNSGDSISYNYIDTGSLVQPITFKEILVFYNGTLINRLTVPSDYIDNNISFTLNSGGNTYSSSFGSGVEELDSYRRIEFT